MNEFILYFYEIGATGAAFPIDEMHSEDEIIAIEVLSSFLILLV